MHWGEAPSLALSLPPPSSSSLPPHERRRGRTRRKEQKKNDQGAVASPQDSVLHCSFCLCLRLCTRPQLLPLPRILYQRTAAPASAQDSAPESCFCFNWDCMVNEINGPGDQLLFKAFIKDSFGWGAQGLTHTPPLLAPDNTEEEVHSFTSQQSWAFLPHRSPQEDICGACGLGVSCHLSAIKLC